MPATITATTELAGAFKAMTVPIPAAVPEVMLTLPGLY
jgi:hypothetical protein